ncbi:MAG: anti-sigma factor [Candidatus Eisenbacteria bacterium]
MDSAHDIIRQQLSDYLDHDLARDDFDAVERHLVSCADCRDTLTALAAVKTRAASLVDPPAPTDLWAGIESRIGTAGSSSAAPRSRPVVVELPRRSRASWFAPQWVAAAAVFAVVAAAALYGARGQFAPALRPDPVAVQPGAGAQAAAASFDADQIEGEIGQLQAALDRGRGKLDPKTVQVLEDNLRIIRKATEDAKAALEADPANVDLQDYLAGSVQRKLDLVRRAAAMAGV